MTAYRNEHSTIFHRFTARMAARRQIRQLAELDDYLLSDIGLTRGDVYEMQRQNA